MLAVSPGFSSLLSLSSTREPPVSSPSPPSSTTVGRPLLFLHVRHRKPHLLNFSSVMLLPDPRQTSSPPLSLSPSSSLPSPTTCGSSRPSLFSVAVGLVSVFINPPVPANSPSQPSTSASSFFSVSFSATQRPSHRRLLSLFPDGLFSSVSPASTPSIVGRILLLRRRSLLPPSPGSRRLPPLVPPSRANASSVPGSQSSVNPVVADARSSLPPFSSLSSAAPRLRHCRSEKTASTSFTAAFLSDTGIDRSVSM